MTKVGSIFESKELVLARTPPWSKKSVTIRTLPYTAKNPTPGQAAQRLRMMDAGPAAAGATAGLYGAARINAMNAHVSQAIKGPTGLARPPGMRAPSRAYNTRAKLEAIKAGGRAGGGGGFVLPPPPGLY